ncbi:helix-turn-helix transcriptional regulator [bacterium]|jgi:DNA-binding XRE family transcriptional regulator|nr:helix-turn-helix transcriptional regulator [bacterium]MBP9810259.1 helix-turn-helix transcriptional regulator [bacterium]
MNKAAIKTASKSTEMNEIRHMQRFLTRSFPAARITVDQPLAKRGVWSLDLFLPDYHLAVAWQKGKGFGIVSNATHGYGEGADEVYETLENALPRIVELVASRRPTVPPEAVRLKELREQRGLSQEEIARRLGSKQASISRAEARSDFLLSTLKKYAEALGATLVVKVVFPDCEMELKLEEAK